MAKLSAVIVCDGAVSSFGQWTLVGVTRTLWGDKLPFKAAFSAYLCFTDVRAAETVVLQLLDPVAAAAGETGAIRWQQEFSLENDSNRLMQEFVAHATGIELLRSVDHELHAFVAGNLVDVVTLEVVA